MSTDTLDPAGVYFGTRSGKLFASRDAGASWAVVAEGLPPVVCVKVAVVDGASQSAARRPARKPAKPRKAARPKAGTRGSRAGGRRRAARRAA
jgi:hypothetical protein